MKRCTSISRGRKNNKKGGIGREVTDRNGVERKCYIDNSIGNSLYMLSQVEHAFTITF